MARQRKGSGAYVLRHLAVALLMGSAQIGNAAEGWSVLSLPQQPGEVVFPTALAVDAAGDLYVADGSNGGRIQKRDRKGNWTIEANPGSLPGLVTNPTALAVDSAGNLYVADQGDGSGRIQIRDARGNWSVVAAQGAAALAVDAGGDLYVAKGAGIQMRDPQGNWAVISASFQVYDPIALAVDTGGNLYVGDAGGVYAVQKRDVQGHWSVIATTGNGLGQVDGPSALAVDSAGSLYAADRPAPDYFGRIQQRDVHGNWSVLAAAGGAPSALALEADGNLYVADTTTYAQGGRIVDRDAQGGWSVIAAPGEAPGQAPLLSLLAVDTAGNLYLADGSNGGRIQKRDPQGGWSVTVTSGTLPGQVSSPQGLAVDAAGDLFVADSAGASGRIEERDARGAWSILDSGQSGPLAADTAGNLYIIDADFRVQKRDAQGNWSGVAATGLSVGQVGIATALAVDAAGNLYVAESYSSLLCFPNRIQKRDAQGNWSVITTPDAADPGYVALPSALAVDAAGNLYVVDVDFDSDGNDRGRRIQKRDAQGNWSILAAPGSAPGQVSFPTALAVDWVGNLYVADTGNSRVLKYTPGVQ